MSLRVVGAGLPRTGTTSLKASLEMLLDGPCYHMTEFFPRADEDGPPLWAALGGDLDALGPVFDGWDAAVDWPASILWKELADQNPDAKVVLSRRSSPAAWWRSANATVWESMRHVDDKRTAAWNDRMRRRAGFGDDWDDPEAAMARYTAHNDEVIAAIAPERLLIWEAAEGWEPLCNHLGVPVPVGEAPRHLNRSSEFRSAHDWDT